MLHFIPFIFVLILWSLSFGLFIGEKEEKKKENRLNVNVWHTLYNVVCFMFGTPRRAPYVGVSNKYGVA